MYREQFKNFTIKNFVVGGVNVFYFQNKKALIKTDNTEVFGSFLVTEITGTLSQEGHVAF